MRRNRGSQLGLARSQTIGRRNVRRMTLVGVPDCGFQLQQPLLKNRADPVGAGQRRIVLGVTIAEACGQRRHLRGVLLIDLATRRLRGGKALLERLARGRLREMSFVGGAIRRLELQHSILEHRADPVQSRLDDSLVVALLLEDDVQARRGGSQQPFEVLWRDHGNRCGHAQPPDLLQKGTAGRVLRLRVDDDRLRIPVVAKPAERRRGRLRPGQRDILRKPVQCQRGGLRRATFRCNVENIHAIEMNRVISSPRIGHGAALVHPLPASPRLTSS
jgi:hypothetical protein